MTHAPAPSRRSFLAASAAAGGGLLLGFRLPLDAAEGAEPAVEVNAWIVVKPDDSVIIRVAHSEMGQGILTALPQLVAEELSCDWSKVSPEFVRPEENLRRGNTYGSMVTTGSRGVRTSQEYLRKAGAGAREMLIAAAAQRWKVPAAECRAAKSIITHEPSGRTLTFGAVADAAAKLAPPQNVALKDPADWTLVGTDVKRLDTRDKVLGKPIFAMDVRLPDMLHAAVAHCPSFGGKLAGYTESAVTGRPGVRAVVALGNAVAVVGDSYWHAAQALRALPVTWDDGPNGKTGSAEIQAFVNSGLSADDAVMVRNDGDAKAVLATAAKVIEAEYHVPFLSHAPMETMNCTARVSDGLVEIWAPTQNPTESLATAARAAGVAPANVVVHPTFSGGGFGRRGRYLDFIAEAVTIAKTVGRPVKLMWSREEDIQHDYYRPISSARFAAGFDADANPIAWTTRIAGQSILSTVDPAALKKGPDLGFLALFTDNPYAVDNLSVDFGMRNTHVPVGYWRSVNHSQNGFFREAFVDEMAGAAGQDPYAFRRKLLSKAPKQLAVMDAAAKQAGWGNPLPAGVFRGIAQIDGYGSYFASVAEVSVGKDGAPRVHRVVTAIDPGYVVNPDSVRAQIEGAVVWALSAALYGEITLKNGRVEQGNFHDYRMLRLREMPQVEVVLAPSGGFWGGVGESGVPAIAPAVVNAMFAATGRRVRSLPILSTAPRTA